MGSLEQPSVREDGLQLDERRKFQEHFWTVERISWCAFALIVIAALFGAFGSGGPIATKVSELRAAVVEHPRIARWEGTDKMKIQFKSRPTVQTRSLFLSNAFAEVFQVEDIQPFPFRTIIEGGGQRLFFENPSRDGGVVTLHLRAQASGSANFDISVDEEVVSLSSFVFP
jgi:hypothetical protein